MIEHTSHLVIWTDVYPTCVLKVKTNESQCDVKFINIALYDKEIANKTFQLNFTSFSKK